MLRYGAKAIPGVKHVVQISSGVAVVGDGYWPAQQGALALQIEWDEGPNAGQSSEKISAILRSPTPSRATSTVGVSASRIVPMSTA